MQKVYKTKKDWVRKGIPWKLCKKLKFDLYAYTGIRSREREAQNYLGLISKKIEFFRPEERT